MANFQSDYNNGIHPKILKALEKTNSEALPGYGDDKFTLLAKKRVSDFFKLKNGDVYFLTGGTQTNLIVIDTMLKPYHGIIAPKTGHINVHESGAIEHTGRKILTLPSHDGKISCEDLLLFLDEFKNDTSPEHVVITGMVYISYPTEYGTLYSKKELQNIYSICKKNNLIFFIDGARLGYGLTSKDCDIQKEEFQNLCDVFYAGGTKQGLLIGEALVFTHKNMPEHFTYLVKQHGALLAKGRALGVQFAELFSNNLYLELSEHANKKAEEIRNLFKAKKITFYAQNKTNQTFVILKNSLVKKISKKVTFTIWGKLKNETSICRFVTSWATKDEEIEELKKALEI